jgi:hypothetical protein
MQLSSGTWSARLCKEEEIEERRAIPSGCIDAVIH